MYPRLLKIESIPPYQSFFLFGPRTTGKSTLIKNYLQNINEPYLIYDLLKTEDFLHLHANPSKLRHEVEAKIKSQQKNILQVVIDEVQRVPTILNEVHLLLETYPKKIRFILSGSSARKLKRGGTNLLAGRAWQRHLHSLTLLEIGNSFSLLEALQFGTLPSLVDKPASEKREQLEAYVATYLKEEIQMEALTRNLESFHRFLETAATCNGELTNISNISREASVPRRTVASYYQILEDTLVGFFLPSWGHQLSRKELVTHGKFYFFDPGIVSALTKNLTAPFQPRTTLFGRAFEHFCVLEFLRLHDYKNTEHKFGFFRTRSGLEIDLVQEQHGVLHAVEIKATATIHPSHLRALKSFGEEFPQARLSLVCTISRPTQMGKIQCLPWSDFFKKEYESGNR